MIRFLIKLPIFKRLIPSIGLRVLRFFKKNRGYFKIGELNFYLDFLDPIDRQIILHKNYENDQVIFLEKENIFGTQFHPEKSDKLGLQIIKNFINL